MCSESVAFWMHLAENIADAVIVLYIHAGEMEIKMMS